ncbi:MAG: band 7 protein [Candidatus Melainabacteria bacterium]|nr:MAG: band 7 protein [Candidatus Melainabacteria bacterium]
MSQERSNFCMNGWLALVFHLLLLAANVYWFWSVIANLTQTSSVGGLLISLAGPIIAGILLLALYPAGYFMLYPNTAKVLTFFGSYAGSVRQTGFLWTNPFYEKSLMSLRLQTVQGPILKVNDKQGNPIEISAINIFHVEDTAKARFDVDNFNDYVSIQTESALRHLATNYAYDHDDSHEMTLRASVDEVSRALQSELQDRLAKAGVQVDEARITHLAYAPEIAMAMLRRQQATAVIAARKQIVDGAVSIVSSALSELSAQHVLELDNERKVAMVSNLLVVLCSESQTQPIVNTGTLYQ